MKQASVAAHEVEHLHIPCGHLPFRENEVGKVSVWDDVVRSAASVIVIGRMGARPSMSEDQVLLWVQIVPVVARDGKSASANEDAMTDLRTGADWKASISQLRPGLLRPAVPPSSAGNVTAPEMLTTRLPHVSAI